MSGLPDSLAADMAVFLFEAERVIGDDLKDHSRRRLTKGKRIRT